MAPALMDELIEEILLRVPPQEPAHLVRASLVCKSWYAIRSDPAFLRRYREFHRTPPLLGFLYNYSPTGDSLIPGFVPTTTTASPVTSPPPASANRGYLSRVMDSRHGRVLVQNFEMDLPLEFVVWDPITGDQKQVPIPQYPQWDCPFRTAAVLCAVVGCDHLHCRGGPFLVVFIGSDYEDDTWATVYSSRTGTWTWSALSRIEMDHYGAERPSLVGNALYSVCELGNFRHRRGTGILKYDLVERKLSVLDPRPELYGQIRTTIVMTIEDGELGFAGMHNQNLHLWSWKGVNEGATGWVLHGIIELDKLIPISVPLSRHVMASVEGTDTIFICTNDGVFTLDIKSRKVSKVSNKLVFNKEVVPYTSFYGPGPSKRKPYRGPRMKQLRLDQQWRSWITTKGGASCSCME